ncbi:hypothetical protein X769_18360 [Mesorhizobium sp. LSJC268A00]|nr:hypothetical protein X769_18360 [Mesorhizobium sp. LSJC268A00]
MPADRLTVRFAYQIGFQVLDGSAILQTFEKQDEAFKFVLGRSRLAGVVADRHRRADGALRFRRSIPAGKGRPHHEDDARPSRRHLVLDLP